MDIPHLEEIKSIKKYEDNNLINAALCFKVLLSTFLTYNTEGRITLNNSMGGSSEVIFPLKEPSKKV